MRRCNNMIDLDTVIWRRIYSIFVYFPEYFLPVIIAKTNCVGKKLMSREKKFITKSEIVIKKFQINNESGYFCHLSAYYFDP